VSESGPCLTWDLLSPWLNAPGDGLRLQEAWKEAVYEEVELFSHRLL
jgi:hypothetical protein